MKKHRQRHLGVDCVFFVLGLLVFVFALCYICSRLSISSETNQETPEQVAAEIETPAAQPPLSEHVSGYTVIGQTDCDDEVVEVLSKLVYGEGGICTTTEQAAIVWCVLNRVDAGYGDILDVATAPMQFVGYSPENPIREDIEALVCDVLARWQMEDTCVGSVGRVLPEDYLWFFGDGVHNYFQNEFRSSDQWDWSLPSPYEEG